MKYSQSIVIDRFHKFSGGNFGVVNEFEFKLRPVRPKILAGIIATVTNDRILTAFIAVMR
jgi:hypothetical protein